MLQLRGHDMPIFSVKEIIVVILCSATISVSCQSEESCAGLARLALNVNPNLLSHCSSDEVCTRLSCQANGALNTRFISVTFTLAPCGRKPGINVDFVQSNGRRIPTQLIIIPTVIHLGDVTIRVSVNGTMNSVDFSVDQISVGSGDIGFTHYLVNLTSIAIDRSECQSGETFKTATPSEESLKKGTGYMATTIGSIAPDARTCAGLEQLAKNTNPHLISKCISNDICSEIICQTSDDISNYLDTVVLSLEPCKIPRGVTFELLKGRQSLFSQLITMPTKISQTTGSATIEALVFVNTTCSTLGISVNPMAISDQSIDSSPIIVDTFMNFTTVPFNVTNCNYEAQFTGEGWSIRVSFELLLLIIMINFVCYTWTLHL